jgi:hypothetical protein
MTDLEAVTGPVHFEGDVAEGDPEAYALSQVGSNGLIRARVMLGKRTVLAANEAFTVGETVYPAGTWILPHRRGLRGQLLEVAQETSLDFQALDDLPSVPTHEVDLPRVALYHTWVSTQPDGWVRMAFDKAGIPYDYIADEEIRDGGLRSKYDVILVAHQGSVDAKTMVLGRDPRFGPQDYRPTREFPSHGHVDRARDITGGMGYEGIIELQKFLDQGGTLILLGSSGVLATDFGLVRNVDTSSARVYTPGAVLQAKVVRPEHPIAYGFDEVTFLARGNMPLYNVPERYDHWIVVKYGTKPLREEDDEDHEKAVAPDEEAAPDEAVTEEQSDGMEGKSKSDGKFLLSGSVEGRDTLEKMGAVIDVPRRDGGRVILYSFNPMHRYLNHGDFNFVYNALLHWNDLPDGHPKDHPDLVKD